ncbi:hypothetical protein K788_0004059 [Paraburkholderia caribensis MBA4]|uniref:Uncharacterized protein n=1 Tax=Paraburkholderia caribensis MBA4 TaxID=1323664 RepID=A0A0P0R5P5_9BURK|nr:hypothetical protein K788_0004059 [Paraburkholderia caribensis MBA4]
MYCLIGAKLSGILRRQIETAPVRSGAVRGGVLPPLNVLQVCRQRPYGMPVE